MPDRADNNLERKERTRIFASIFTFMLIGLVCVAVVLTAIYFDRESTFQDDLMAAVKAASDREIGERLLAAYNSNATSDTKEYFDDLRAAEPAARDLRHLLMVTAIELGETEFAAELKTELAPENGKSGYGQSHFLAGIQIPANSSNRSVNQKELGRMVGHFRIAALDKTVPVEIHRWLGDCYFAVKDYGNAVIEYRELDDPSPLVRYKLALSLSKTPNRGQASEEMKTAIAGFNARLLQNKNDLGAVVYRAKGLFHLGRFTEAENSLTTRLTIDKDETANLTIRRALIGIYMSRLLRIKNRLEQKQLLEQICHLDPGLRITPGLSRQAFFLLGNILANEKRYDEAKAHFLMSTRGMNVPASVKNNMAWLEMNSQNADLESAIKLSDEAIGKSKTPRPEFIGTRGQILARMGRWIEAKRELESIVETVGDQKQVQLALAVVYLRLGEPKKAKRLFAQEYIGPKTLDQFAAEYPE